MKEIPNTINKRNRISNGHKTIKYIVLCRTISTNRTRFATIIRLKNTVEKYNMINYTETSQSIVITKEHSDVSWMSIRRC